MKLTTRISHARIRVKHWFLKLRVQTPVYYKALSALVLVFAMGGLVAAYFAFLAKPQAPTYAEQFDLPIKTYSANGVISMGVSDGSLQVKVGIVRVVDNQNQLVHEYKTVAVTESTEIVKVIFDGKRLTTSEGSAADLKPGREIVVYTTTDPSSKNVEMAADRIEVLEK